MISTTDMNPMQNLTVDGPMADRLLDDYQRVCCTVHGATITPEGAGVFNRRNNNNFRRLNPAHADMLAVEMQRGRFTFNGMPISFDTRGSLVNGQHRLDACIRSQSPFVTNIVFGLTPGIQRKTDIGQMKRGADAVLRDLHVPNYSTASAVCRDAIACIRNRAFIRSVSHVAESEIAGFYQEHRQAVDDAVTFSLQIRDVFKPSEIGALFLFLIKLRRKTWTSELVDLIAGDAPAKRTGSASAFARLAWKHRRGGDDAVACDTIRRSLLAAANIEWLGTKCDGTKPLSDSDVERHGGTLHNLFPQEIISRV